MLEKRIEHISEKVISTEELIDFFQEFGGVVNNLLKEVEHLGNIKQSFKLRSSNGEEMTAEKFAEYEVLYDELSKSRVEYIKLHVMDMSTTEFLTLILSTGGSGFNNQLIVQSRDKVVLNDAFGVLNSHKNKWKDQSRVLGGHPTLYPHVISIILVIAFFGISYWQRDRYDVPFIENLFLDFFQHFEPAHVIMVLILYGVNFFIIESALKRVWKLWPSVELQTGREHHWWEEGKRQKLLLYFTIMIMPMALELIFLLL